VPRPREQPWEGQPRGQPCLHEGCAGAVGRDPDGAPGRHVERVGPGAHPVGGSPPPRRETLRKFHTLHNLHNPVSKSKIMVQIPSFKSKSDSTSYQTQPPRKEVGHNCTHTGGGEQYCMTKVRSEKVRGDVFCKDPLKNENNFVDNFVYFLLIGKKYEKRCKKDENVS